MGDVGNSYKTSVEKSEEMRQTEDQGIDGRIILESILTFLFSSEQSFHGHVARMGELRGAYNILVRRPEGGRPLGRPRRRWEDNIKMDLREIGFEDVDWIHWAQDRDRWRAVVNTVMNLRVP
jgi:hypothetical protein